MPAQESKLKKTLAALVRAQVSRRAELAELGSLPSSSDWVWVRASSVRDLLPSDLRAGVGPRLAALERRGLAESMCGEQSWDLRKRYDVVWRPTPDREYPGVPTGSGATDG